jgi:hypothetical protein
MEKNLTVFDTHDLIQQPLELDLGLPLNQLVCLNCGRDFIEECSTGKRYGVSISAFRVDRLSDEVTSRWLSEMCPGERLTADDEDRRTRFLNSPVANPRPQGRAPTRAR